MKKNIFLAVMLTAGTLSAQKVGINTENPKATLDVNKVESEMLADGVLAPRLTRAALTLKGNSLYGADQKGALVYITDVTGGDAATGTQREEVTEEGYYYFDGAKWQRIVFASEYDNFYLSDGTLQGNRIVTQGDKTLSFETTVKGGTTFQTTGGTAAKPVPSVKIVDGKQELGNVLVSDADGNAKWEAPAAPVYMGTFSDSGVAVDITDETQAYYTGISITLTKGTWILSVGAEAKMLMPDGVTTRGAGSRWGVFFLRPADADGTIPASVAGDSGIISQNSNFTVEDTQYLAAMPIPTHIPTTTVWGSQTVTVNTDEAQTLYVYFMSKQGSAAGTNFGTTGYRIGAGSFSSAAKGSYFSAIKTGISNQ